MKLYVTLTSPYARIARIVFYEKGLQSRVEVIPVETRIPDNPYYSINPSGRVPYLVREDGVGLQESALISAYLDHLDGAPAFDPPAGEEGWEVRRLEALARSLLDGLAVGGRELRRPADERSPTIMEHELQRSGRMLDLWEKEIEHPAINGPLNMAQITLISALQLELLNPLFVWRPKRRRLSAWANRLGQRASIAATRPLTGF